jgi:hypothetical protein
MALVVIPAPVYWWPWWPTVIIVVIVVATVATVDGLSLQTAGAVAGIAGLALQLAPPPARAGRWLSGGHRRVRGHRGARAAAVRLPMGMASELAPGCCW